VDGIGTAIADVITLVMEGTALDVLLLQETKLIPANPTPTLPGYSSIRHDQPPNPGGRGSGLLTYVKADIPFRQIPAYREEEVADGLEALAVEIQRGARGKFVVTNLYMPPSGREVRVVSSQGRLGYQLPNSSLGATSMHIPPSGMTPNPEMGLEPSWRSG
jgi:exonuclease III